MVLRTIEFRVKHKLDYGSNFAIAGLFLRNWDLNFAKPLEWSPNDAWFVRMEEKTEGEFDRIEFKVIIAKGKEIVWEEGHNRVVSLPAFEEVRN